MGHLGYLGAILPLTVVLGNFILVIFNTYGMVYITYHVDVITLDKNLLAKVLRFLCGPHPNKLCVCVFR